MLAVGAAKSWMNDAPVVEPLRLRRVPLLAVVVCFAAGDLIALRWQPPLLLVAATAILLALSILSLRRTLRLAIIPTCALWIAIGCWCAQIEPPIPQQQALQHVADGLSRNVRGSVVRVRTLPAPARNTPQLEFEPGAWETDDGPSAPNSQGVESTDTQSIDIDVQAVEYLTPDLSTMQPVAGGVRLTLSGAALPLHCGDTIEVPLRLRTPDVYRDPRRLVLLRLSPQRRNRRHLQRELLPRSHHQRRGAAKSENQPNPPLPHLRRASLGLQPPAGLRRFARQQRAPPDLSPQQ